LQLSRFTSITKWKNSILLINGLSGAIDIVDGNTANIIFKNRKQELLTTSKQRKLVRLFEKRGHLTSRTSNEEYAEAVSFSKKYSKKLSLIKKVHIIVPSYKCNLRCTYCLQSRLRKKQQKWLQKTMDETTVNRVFDAIKQIDGPYPNPLPIHIYGGEPLLPENADIVKYILKLGKSLGRRFYFVTNGVYLRDFIRLLRRFDIDGVQITLDGIRRVHDVRRIGIDGKGSFDQIIESIEAARKAGFRLSIRICTDSSNIKELPELARFIESMGWDTDKNITPYIAPVRGEGICYQFYPWNVSPNELAAVASNDATLSRMVRYVFHSIQKKTISENRQWIPQVYYCEAIFSQIYYDAHGDLYACTGSLGNKLLRTGRFMPKLEFNALYREWTNRHVFSLQKCQKCRNALVCGGGCSYNAFLNTRSISTSECMSFSVIQKQYLRSMFGTLSRPD